MAKVISIANQKGGVGKTTSCIEIGAALSDMNKKVLVIDLDQQSNLSKYVEADLTKPSIYSVLNADASVVDAIQHLKWFDVICASQNLSKADKQFVDFDDIFLLSDVLEMIKDDYDYILIDNSPSRNILLTMNYVASDYVIIPTECDDGALDGISMIHKDILKLKEGRTHSHSEIIGFLLTKKERTIMHSVAMETIEEYANEINEDAFIIGISKSIITSECKTYRKPLQEHKKYHDIAIEYRNVAKKILELD